MVKPVTIVLLGTALLIAGCAEVRERAGGLFGKPDAAETLVESAPSEPEAAPKPAPPDPPDAIRLLGKEAADVQDLLGVPKLVRRENHAQVMQYHAPGCVFDIYLYEASRGGPFTATYVESRDIFGQLLDRSHCLAALIPKADWADWDIPVQPVQAAAPAPD